MKSRRSFSIKQEANSLANYLPTGVAWIAKFVQNTVFRGLLLGFSEEIKRVEDLITQIADEHYVRQSDLLLSYWMATFGIPDDCFKNVENKEIVRNDILVKFFTKTQTRRDWIAIAEKLGFEVEIEVGTEIGDEFDTGEFPFELAGAPLFTILIFIKNKTEGEVFPLTFPATFPEEGEEVLKCFFKKIKPAHCVILFKYA